MQPVLRVLAMPADANASGTMFGGWIMSQMDIAGGIAACGYARARTATVAVKDLRFLASVNVGEVLVIRALIERAGSTSVTVKIEAKTADRTAPEKAEKPVAAGTFIYVALDEEGGKMKLSAAE